jgi:preprotein translocase subunit SecE
MSKTMAKLDRAGTFWQALLTADLYKRNQGRLVRQLTAAAIAVAVGLGAYSLWVAWLAETPPWLQWGLPGLVAVLGLWFAYRIINYPPFAEFLANVEGEMLKVTWPSTKELMRATVVVLVTMTLFSAVLFGYDLIWQAALRAIGVLKF